MPIQAQCPGCGRKFQAPDKLAGRRVECPNCAAVIHVAGGQQQETIPQAAPGREAPQAPKPPGSPGGPREAQWYVKTAAGEELGPMSKARLDGLVAEGRLNGFCRVRREDWPDWKWAEAVYPQFALSVQPEGPAADAKLPDEADAQAVAGDADSRLRPCPDCEKLVSRRASHCPHCGCPLSASDSATPAAGADSGQTDETSPTAASPPARDGGLRRHVGLVVAGAVAATVLIAAVAAVVGWQWWRRSQRALDQVVESLAVDLTAHEQPPQPRKLEGPTRKATTPEEMQRYMQEAAAAAARKVDELGRRVHLAASALQRTQESAELLRSIIEDPLGRPGEKLAPATEPEDARYQSQYKPLYDECLAYLRKNIPAGQLDSSKVWELANRWVTGKQAAVEKQFGGQLEGLLLNPEELLPSPQ